MEKEIKKIYIKQWKESRLKKTLILAILVGLITNLLVFLVCSKDINSYYEDSVKNNTNIKYIIPSPSLTQISELKEKPYVNQINTTSYLNLEVVIDNNSVEVPIIVIDSKTSLDNTPFSSKRLIKGSNHLEDGTVFIDYLFFVKNKVNINESLKIKIGTTTKTYKVSGIYETNTLVNSEMGSIFIYRSNELIDLLNENNKKLIITNAYIDATNEIEDDYLSNYKAYGRLKERSEFPTEEAYQIHYNNFMNANFSAEIIYLNNKIGKSSKIVIITIINSIILLAFSMYNIIHLNNSKEKTFIKKMINYGVIKKEKSSKQKNHIDKANGNKKKLYIVNYYLKSYLLELFIMVLFIVIPTLIYYFIINSNGIYINKNDKIIYLISNLVAVILSIVINLTYTKKLYYKISNKENKK